jgi:cyclophilin family peptidyl-prolyl cis-trans isomerase
MAAKNPVVTMETSMGTIKIELYPDKAPITVKNFISYVKDKHYDGVIFHRVIPGFMIQGGGMEPGMREKRTRPPSRMNRATASPTIAAPSPWPAPTSPTAPPPSSSST